MSKPGFVTLRDGPFRWRVQPYVAKSALFEELRILIRDRSLPADDPVALKRKRWSIRHRTVHHERDLHVKFSIPRHFRESVKYGLRPTRAAAEWRHSLRLR